MYKYLTVSPLCSSFLLPPSSTSLPSSIPSLLSLRFAPSHIRTVRRLSPKPLLSTIAHTSPWQEHDLDFGQEGYSRVARTVPRGFPGRFQLLGILQLLQHLLLLGHLPPLRLLLYSTTQECLTPGTTLSAQLNGTIMLAFFHSRNSRISGTR